jgi:lysyl-tRNA synthetase class I
MATLKTEIQKVLSWYNVRYHEYNPIASICKDLEESAQVPVINQDDLFWKCYCGYEETVRISLKTEKYLIQVTLYRMPSGRYECTAYICN